VKVSALVITLNEKDHIVACLDSLASAQSIVVIDSGSTDGTPELAAAHPRTTVRTRPFAGFADQRNFGLDNCFRSGDWVLHLDADERLTPELAAEIAALESGDQVVAFNLACRTYLGGHPVLRASGYPVYQTRLTRAGHFRFEEVGHGQKAPASLGPLPSLQSPYDHHPFEKGFREWHGRHATYAAKEAAALSSLDGKPTLRQALADPIRRRQWIKHVTAGLWMRPWLVWGYLMFVRLGVLDGSPGWEYCRRRFLYERMVNERIGALMRGRGAQR